MSTSESGSPVLFEIVDQHIAVVTLNRPEARNAINGEMAAAMERHLIRIEEDPSIWACILAARGDQTFCAGADLKEVARGNASSLATERGGFAGFVQAPKTRPWIAAVHASALGGGLELSLACDLIVCAQDAQLGLPEVKRGVIALAGGLSRLPRAIPRAVALEMIATGRPIDAGRAHALGLVNHVVPGERVLARALELAREICENAPLAVRESLRLARLTEETPLAQMQQLGRQSMVALANTEDFRIGPKAFAEKRKPQWTGR